MPSGTKPAPGWLSHAVGAILRGRMARINLTTSALAETVGVSRPQLSKMLRASAHMDIEQFDTLCDRLDLNSALVLAEAKNDVENDAALRNGLPTVVNQATDLTELPPSEVGRRLRTLVEHVTAGDAAAGYRQVLTSATRTATYISPGEWAAALSGDSTLGYHALSVIADSMGVPTGYLTRASPELTERVEAELLLARAMGDAGATRVAARGRLSPEALREIAALVSQRISKK